MQSFASFVYIMRQILDIGSCKNGLKAAQYAIGRIKVLDPSSRVLY